MPMHSKIADHTEQCKQHIDEQLSMFMMPMHNYQQIMMPFENSCIAKDDNDTHDHQVHSHKDADDNFCVISMMQSIPVP